MSTPPTKEQLQRMVPVVCKLVGQIPCFHVFEEYVAQRFGKGEAEVSLQAYMHNAALDSALLSLRCFNEFFKPGGREDDVRAHHFPVPALSPFLPPDEERAIHKHLAHLTLTRMNLAETPWYVDQMVLRGLEHGIRFLSPVESGFPLGSESAAHELRGVREGCGLFINKITNRHRPQDSTTPH